MSRKKINTGLISSILIPRMMALAGVNKKVDLAKILGIAPQSLNKYQGNDREIPSDWAIQFMKRTKISLEDLTKTEEGEPMEVALTGDESSESTAPGLGPRKLFRPDHVIPYAARRVKAIGDLPDSGKEVVLGLQDILMQVTRKWVADHFARSADHLLAWIVEADNMAPTINRDSLIMIDKSTNTITGDGIYAFININTGLILRRVMKRVNGTVDLVNDNERYRTYNSTAEELLNLKEGGTRILGRVVFAGNPM